MATTIEVEIQGQQNLDIESLVSEPTWKDILIDLVKGNKLDPWDIDIILIVDKYIEAVHSMKVISLRVPANIALAAALLLKYKSDMLVQEEQEQQAMEEEARLARPSVVVDPISFRLRIPPRRRMTLTELVTALDEAIKLKEFKATAARQEQIQIPVMFSGVDIEAEIERVHALLKQHADQSSMITFSEALKFSNSQDAITGLFLPLIFLWHKDRVLLIQEKFFGDIIIALK